MPWCIQQLEPQRAVTADLCTARRHLPEEPNHSPAAAQPTCMMIVAPLANAAGAQRPTIAWLSSSRAARSCAADYMQGRQTHHNRAPRHITTQRADKSLQVIERKSDRKGERAVPLSHSAAQRLNCSRHVCMRPHRQPRRCQLPPPLLRCSQPPSALVAQPPGRPLAAAHLLDMINNRGSSRTP